MTNIFQKKNIWHSMSSPYQTEFSSYGGEFLSLIWDVQIVYQLLKNIKHSMPNNNKNLMLLSYHFQRSMNGFTFFTQTFVHVYLKYVFVSHFVIFC